MFSKESVRRIGGKIGLLVAGMMLGGALLVAQPSFAAGPVLASAVQTPAPGSPAPGSATPSGTQTAGPSPQQRMAYCQTYERTLADHLKVSQSSLESAQRAAIAAALQQAVSDGTMSQAKATQIEQHIAQNGFCSGMGYHHGMHGTPMPGGMGAPTSPAGTSPGGAGTTTP